MPAGRNSGNGLKANHPSLPAGCLLDVELEARDVLGQFIPTGSQAGLETYRMLRDELARRPQATELFAHSILPKTVSKSGRRVPVQRRQPPQLQRATIRGHTLGKSVMGRQHR